MAATAPRPLPAIRMPRTPRSAANSR
jgi:hypothetical protein